jgi:hypothetical protein
MPSPFPPVVPVEVERREARVRADPEQRSGEILGDLTVDFQVVGPVLLGPGSERPGQELVIGVHVSVLQRRQNG